MKNGSFVAVDFFGFSMTNALLSANKKRALGVVTGIVKDSTEKALAHLVTLMIVPRGFESTKGCQIAVDSNSMLEIGEMVLDESKPIPEEDFTAVAYQQLQEQLPDMAVSMAQRICDLNRRVSDLTPR